MYQTFPVKMKEARAFKGKPKTLGYFEEMIWRYHHGDDPCLLLPSLKELAHNMDCSTLDIQCALNNLRKQGYDYFMIELDGPLTVWYPDKINSLPES